MTNFINFITLSRIILAPTILIFIIFGNYFVSFLLFIFAGFTDYLDGYLARKYNSESQLGEILDPIADKILVVFILIGISIELDSYLIGFLSSCIISREIVVAALRDYSARNNLLEKTKVTFLAKIKTTCQLFTILLYLFALTISFNLLIVLCDILLVTTTLITLFTGYQYVLNVLDKWVLSIKSVFKNIEAITNKILKKNKLLQIKIKLYFYLLSIWNKLCSQ